eukprot:CAMPEP_0171758788 /NCGR_PEP_ID=MMETSP0991-20121206/46488_1 /TAXON_ID=483369 /ORGANISM="non described non described, Strain CCMP2098" /LENGTH=77 /DNA_ID=CAMNT_0012361565 /DNA_START=10 /DNA_END=240 /DNA_ORIENTATION=-
MAFLITWGGSHQSVAQQQQGKECVRSEANAKNLSPRLPICGHTTPKTPYLVSINEDLPQHEDKQTGRDSSGGVKLWM